MKNKQIIIPSILTKDIHKAQKMINTFPKLSRLHLDIMDGKFVHTKSITKEQLPLLNHTAQLTAHLMVADPIAWLPYLAKTKIKKAFIHISTIKKNKKFFQEAKKQKVKIGLAFAPNENPEDYEDLLIEFQKDITSFITVTVKPGKYGATHRPDDLYKTAYLKRLLPKKPNYVDGGIGESQIPLALRRGADHIIVGSGIWKTKKQTQRYSVFSSKKPKPKYTSKNKDKKQAHDNYATLHKIANQKIRPVIYITRYIPEAGINELRKHADLIINPKCKTPSKRELYRDAKKADVILSLLTDPIDAQFIQTNKHLQIIANYAIGFNNIDITEASKYHIPVTNTPGEFAGTVADHTFALLLGVAHRIIEEDTFMDEDQYKCWSPTLLRGKEVHHKTMGIIGFGSIGQEVAHRAQGFKMQILYYDHKRAPKKIEKQYNARFVSCEKLLKTSDFVSLHVPLIPETVHLINKKHLNMMKRSAIIINTARGPVINEDDLVKALQSKKIAGAGLDVFEHEPNCNKVLKKMENVILTPHVASSTREARDLMAVIASRNIIQAIQGKSPPNKLN